nr:hypothetical protein BaRGS_015075 [Batillaria attramentaria]
MLEMIGPLRWRFYRHPRRALAGVPSKTARSGLTDWRGHYRNPVYLINEGRCCQLTLSQVLLLLLLGAPLFTA